jgi:hypothetical protein
MKIEDEIRKQRHQLDQEEAPIDAMWANIDGRINKKKSMPWKGMLAAASVILLIALGYWMGSESAISPLADNQVKSLNISDVDQEVAIEEEGLKNEYDQKLATLASYEFNPETVVVFQEELDELDRLDLEMRQMLGKVQNQEKLLRTLLEHYHKRMKIVDRMIQKIEREKRKETRQNEVYI